MEDKETAKKTLNPFTKAKNQLDVVTPSLPVEICSHISEGTLEVISHLHKCSKKHHIEEIRRQEIESEFNKEEV